MPAVKSLTKGQIAGCIILCFVCTLICLSASINDDITSVFSTLWLTSALFAALILMIPSWFLLAIPLITGVVTALITKNPLTAAVSVSFALCGAVYANCILRKKSKRDTMLACALVTAFLVLISFMLIVVADKGVFTVDSIKEFYTDLLSDYILQLQTQLGTASTEMFSYDFYISNAYIIPAMFALYVFTTALLGATLIKYICKWFGCDDSIFSFDKIWDIRFSKVSAGVYIIFLFLIVFQSTSAQSGADASTAFYAFVYTFYIPLMLAMSYIGLREIYRIFGKTKKKKIITVLILSICIYFSLFVFTIFTSLLTFFGAYVTLKTDEKQPWKTENI